jgi:hypothetical protein
VNRNVTVPEGKSKRRIGLMIRPPATAV